MFDLRNWEKKKWCHYQRNGTQKEKMAWEDDDSILDIIWENEALHFAFTEFFTILLWNF